MEAWKQRCNNCFVYWKN